MWSFSVALLNTRSDRIRCLCVTVQGSHVLGRDAWDKHKLELPCPVAGTPIIFDYRLGHRGMGNRNDRVSRPVLYFTYANIKKFKVGSKRAAHLCVPLLLPDEEDLCVHRSPLPPSNTHSLTHSTRTRKISQRSATATAFQSSCHCRRTEVSACNLAG